MTYRTVDAGSEPTYEEKLRAPPPPPPTISCTNFTANIDTRK